MDKSRTTLQDLGLYERRAPHKLNRPLRFDRVKRRLVRYSDIRCVDVTHGIQQQIAMELLVISDASMPVLSCTEIQYLYSVSPRRR